MKKWDVYGYILRRVEEGTYEFTQRGIAKALGGSLSVVNYSLKPLLKMGAIEKYPMGFRVVNPMKIVVHMANVYSADWNYMYIRSDVEEIEKNLPQGLYTAFSGAKIYYGIDVSDYDSVFFFGDVKEVEKRFSGKRYGGTERDIMLRNNLFYRDIPIYLEGLKKTPLFQIYVDVWNTPYWFSVEFERAIYDMLRERWS